MLLVIDGVLGKDEVAQFRERLDQAEWTDGARTAGTLAREVKANRQLDERSETAVALGARLLRRLGTHPLFLASALPERIYPPRFNLYAAGERYGVHVDSPVMRVEGAGVTVRADVSATLFLSEPAEYEGGELTIEGQFGAQQVKLGAGDMVLYPSSSLHQVEPVTSGARIGAFFWVQSMVQDVSRRALLFDLDQSIQALAARCPADDPELLRLTAVYSNLLRMWAVV